MEVQVDAGGRADAPVPLLERAVRLTCRLEGAEDGEVSLALLGDPAIALLNREHLGREGPTDVLAFALWEEGEPVVGDIYVGVDEAARRAAEAGVPLEEELVRLAVHGTLHVLGWDHPEDPEARPTSPMYRRQEELVDRVVAPRS